MKSWAHTSKTTSFWNNNNNDEDDIIGFNRRQSFWTTISTTDSFSISKSAEEFINKVELLDTNEKKSKVANKRNISTRKKKDFFKNMTT